MFRSGPAVVEAVADPERRISVFRFRVQCLGFRVLGAVFRV